MQDQNHERDSESELESDSADTDLQSGRVDLEAILAAVDDDQGDPANAGILTEGEDLWLPVSDESLTSIDIDASGTVTLTPDDSAGFSISFTDVTTEAHTEAPSEPIRFDVGESAALVPQLLDGYFRGIYVLENADAPTDLTHVITGDSARVLALSDDGGVTVQDESGEEIGGLAAPWARDANNRRVPTHFSVDGQTVRQTVDITDLDDVAFPVVADPLPYVNTTKRSVINIKNHGNVSKWSYLNKCTAGKNKSCSIGRTYTKSATVQTALNTSAKFIGASIGITAGASTQIDVKCSVNGPGSVTLYASANKKTYKVRTVRTYGPPIKLKRETKTSGTLAAYKPNGKYVCS